MNETALITDEVRALLLGVALGEHTVRTEHRFRHRETGETAEKLDLRTMEFADWDGESRTIIETDWRERP